MPAYIPNYEHDLFVSYAHVDNRPRIRGDEDSAWVTTLTNQLRIVLSQKLGRSDLDDSAFLPDEETDIWRDPRLTGNEGVTPALEQAVTNSANLLVILSEGYLQSEWCRRELEIFLKARGGLEQANGRIFVVARDPIERPRWPAEFQDLLGYEFYEKSASDGRVRTLAVPKLKPDEDLYFTRLDDLSMDLVNSFRRLKSALEPSQESTSVAPANIIHNGCVFLADVPAELEPVREEIKRYLMHVNIRVLPTTFYNRAPAAYGEALSKDLAQTDLFVQLLGSVPAAKTEELPGGYGGMQLDRATALNKPIIRWRDPNLDLSAVHDKDHLSQLADNVTAMDLETFKREIENQVRSSLVQPVGPEIEGDFFILVNAAEDDIRVAEEISDRLETHEIGYYVASESSIDELAEEDDYDSLMVVYGSCSPTWVTEQVRLCRRVMLKKKPNPPVCVVYFGPPEEKERLRCKPPRMLTVAHTDKGSFEKFVSAVQARRDAE